MMSFVTSPKRMFEISAPLPIRARADTELTRCLQEQPIDSTADPLAWWRDNMKQNENS